jgi:hypothetical protein
MNKNKIISNLNITFKNTMPIYVVICISTLLILFFGNSLNQYSIFGTTFFADVLFSITYNLLYLIPQSTAIFLGMFIIKKSPKWFIRLVPSICVITTFFMILIFKFANYFPKEVNVKNLYIFLFIIITMNVIFVLVMMIKIMSKIKYGNKKIISL